MVKDKKFQYKWFFDPTMAKCSDTGIWCLTYIDGLGMFFCAVCLSAKKWFQGLELRAQY